VGPIQHTVAWVYLYGAVAPATGARLCLALSYPNAATFRFSGDAFAQAFPDSSNSLLLDTSGAQMTQGIRWPAHGQAVWLPPDGPELHPVERGWRDVQGDLAWQPYVDLEAPQVSVGDVWQADDAPTLHALRGYA
jgi:hypothetical protein